MPSPRLPPTAALAAGLALAGCLGVGAEPHMVPEATVDDPTLEPGSWVNVTYRLENQGDAPYTYQHPGCPPAVVDGRAQGPGPTVELYEYRDSAEAGTCMIRNVTVAPGEAVEGTVNWNGHQDDDPPDPHRGDRVPAGDHTVTVELARADGGLGFPANVTVEVQG